MWLEKIILNAPQDVVAHVLSLCYGIWFARNKKCFEDRNIDIPVTISKAWKLVEEFKARPLVQVVQTKC